MRSNAVYLFALVLGPMVVSANPLPGSYGYGGYGGASPGGPAPGGPAPGGPAPGGPAPGGPAPGGPAPGGPAPGNQGATVNCNYPSNANLAVCSSRGNAGGSSTSSNPCASIGTGPGGSGMGGPNGLVPECCFGRLWRCHYEPIFADRLVIFRNLRQRQPMLGHRIGPGRWRPRDDGPEWHLHQLRLPIQPWPVVMPIWVQKLAAQLQAGPAQGPRGLRRILPLDSRRCQDHKPVSRRYGSPNCLLPMNFGNPVCSCQIPMNSELPQCKPVPTSPKPIDTPTPAKTSVYGQKATSTPVNSPTPVPTSKPSTPASVDCSNVANYGKSACACTNAQYSTLSRCQPSTITTTTTQAPTATPETTPVTTQQTSAIETTAATYDTTSIPESAPESTPQAAATTEYGSIPTPASSASPEATTSQDSSYGYEQHHDYNNWY
ncbi:hypothetical protein PG999_005737 [Apiospora kogelbergensis]|uniref:Uncharacterized protein n=1 Tax=Apiospora kogelbergensis TaxID=1337665 RepID=A0AAW0QPC0_9PEZI